MSCISACIHLPLNYSPHLLCPYSFPAPWVRPIRPGSQRFGATKIESIKAVDTRSSKLRIPAACPLLLLRDTRDKRNPSRRVLDSRYGSGSIDLDLFPVFGSWLFGSDLSFSPVDLSRNSASWASHLRRTVISSTSLVFPDLHANESRFRRRGSRRSELSSRFPPLRSQCVMSRKTKEREEPGKGRVPVPESEQKSHLPLALNLPSLR